MPENKEPRIFTELVSHTLLEYLNLNPYWCENTASVGGFPTPHNMIVNFTLPEVEQLYYILWCLIHLPRKY